MLKKKQNDFIYKKNQTKTKFIPILLITLSTVFLFIMLVMPLIVVMTEAFKHGIAVYKKAVLDHYTLKALLLTLEATVIAVAINTVFGLFAAWTITKYQFRKKKLLTTLIDIPFAISPIIAGLIFILTFGRIGWAHDILTALDIKIVFAVPGVILGTVFVTFPFISREIIPVLNAQGSDQEEAAAIMGAGAFKIFRKITFPQIKWAFLYGVILCTARAMGEFGAVSVLSGHLRGKTITLPLQVEIFFSEFNFTAAFAVSSMLVILALIILIIRNILEYKMKKAGI
ncbi:MAG: sulfate ABC transporter permease subunit CysW [Anaerocolumna sp.]